MVPDDGSLKEREVGGVIGSGLLPCRTDENICHLGRRRHGYLVQNKFGDFFRLENGIVGSLVAFTVIRRALQICFEQLGIDESGRNAADSREVFLRSQFLSQTFGHGADGKFRGGVESSFSGDPMS